MSSSAPDTAQRITPELLAHLQSWQGRTETLDDLVTPAPLRALSATLDRDDPLPAPGTELPPLWHWLFFLPHHRQSEIGPDGHARRGGFLPPVPLPRRMWAGAACNGMRRCVWATPSSVARASSRSRTRAGAPAT